LRVVRSGIDSKNVAKHENTRALRLAQVDRIGIGSRTVVSRALLVHNKGVCIRVLVSLRAARSKVACIMELCYAVR
jgi:hypothetical protein